MKVLVTGGAGFIGSHIVSRMLEEGADAVVLDDLSTGFREHVPGDVRLVEASITDPDAVREAVEGVELVFHEAASRAVHRSVDDPIGTNHVNVDGTLGLLVAARDAGVRRVVLASSSSVYGGQAPLPTPEDAPVAPKSPYAVSKLSSEHYARVFWELYGLETVSLRYFNVFGPRQRPDSPYAAVIPIFTEALMAGRTVEIHGDGLQSRDFTYIDDVVEANVVAAFAPEAVVAGKVYNVARGGMITVLEVLDTLRSLTGAEAAPVFGPARPGDVWASQADVSRIASELGFRAETGFEEGLRAWVAWFRNHAGARESSEDRGV